MLLGIDVGGTFTDAVVISDGQVVAQAKTPTTPKKLLIGILDALDKLLPAIDKTAIERVALSTTIVTNALVQGKADAVGLIMLPGPGLDIAKLVPDEPYILSGYIDHRGREVAAPERNEVAAACRELKDRPVFAVAGKFAVRNPIHEVKVGEWVQEVVQPRHITLAANIAGTLNFLRRTNSAYYNAAVWRHFGDFARAIEDAMVERGITAPMYILKADGGTMPLAAARANPVEAIFTGPAASVLGIMATTPPKTAAVSLDIGGTTTDIALWSDGVPLFAERGAVIAGYPTAVRAFRLRSVGVGGDSLVQWDTQGLKVGPIRQGRPQALGGPAPTVTDAMIVTGKANFGDHRLARQAMARLSKEDQSPEQVAELVLQQAAKQICEAIDMMITERAAEPVYRVDDIINSTPLEPEVVIGVGGAASGLAPLVAARMGIPCNVPKAAMVANAIGAAVARPTVAVTLRADTEQGYYAVAELGARHKLSHRRFDLADARQEAARQLVERASQVGVAVDATETVYEEEFNLVRGFSTTGKIITCQLQIKPGVLMTVAGGEAAL